MSKKIIILWIIIALIAVILLAAGVYYFLFAPKIVKIAPITTTSLPIKKTQKPLPFVPPDPVRQLAEAKKEYPEVIIGTIKFLDTKDFFKTTLKTNSGVVYTLWPPQPEVVYESFGAKNNGKVQVNGKPLDNGMLSWILMKPI